MKNTTNNSLVQACLFFEGRCEEAIHFYKKVLGAELLMLMRFKDNPEPSSECMKSAPPEKVMHAQFRIGDTVIMAGDGRCSGQPNFQGFSLSLTLPSEAQVDKAFNALAEGGQIQMPLGKTFFTERFGMVIDRFGVFWMILKTPVPAGQPAAEREPALAH
jgi:PhnB protein